MQGEDRKRKRPVPYVEPQGILIGSWRTGFFPDRTVIASHKGDHKYRVCSSPQSRAQIATYVDGENVTGQESLRPVTSA
jgi:hypothetical protein